MVAPTSAMPFLPPAAGRMAAVQDMARLQRARFEVEREFVRTATTLIYRVAELAKVYGGRTPHALPPDRRLTGRKIMRLAGVS